jgi:hypothetical protein
MYDRSVWIAILNGSELLDWPHTRAKPVTIPQLASVFTNANVLVCW